MAETAALEHNDDFRQVDRAGATAMAPREEVAERSCTRIQCIPGSASGRRAQLRRQQTTAFSTKEELMAKGFTAGQAAGVMAGRRQQSPESKSLAGSATNGAARDVGCGAAVSSSGASGGNRSEASGAIISEGAAVAGAEPSSQITQGLGGEGDGAARASRAKHASELADLRRLKVPLSQLLELGFSASTLASGGFSPAELREAGVLVSKSEGFTPLQLQEAGYSLSDLRQAGFGAAIIRCELNLRVEQLHEAGYTAAQMKQAGYGPGELLSAGYSLEQIRQAGYTAVFLHQKCGFALEVLRRAGFSLTELRAVPGVWAPALLSAGFTRAQLRSVFSDDEIEGRPTATGQSSPPVKRNLFDVSLAASAAKKREFKLPEKYHIKAGIEALDASPPATVVVGSGGRVYGSTSIFCLRPATQPRKLAIHLCESSYFEALVLLTIFANVCTMAWESPLDPPDTPKASLIRQCEAAFLGVYTVELATKVVAYGFLMHRHSYLRDPWCQLDFVVVSLAWLPILLPSWRGANVNVIRSVRALRPLRALKRLPGMPALVGSILGVLPRMRDVGMLCAFIFIVFAIVGTELFKGDLHYRCSLPGFVEQPHHPIARDRLLGERDTDTPSNENDAVEMLVASQAAFDTDVACNPQLPAVLQCGPRESCSYFEANPGVGLVSFDSVGRALIILLQSMTFDDWGTPMYALMRSASPYVWIYFVLVLVLGGFFVGSQQPILQPFASMRLPAPSSV